MKILITAVHYPVASGRYVFNALKRMGHDMRSLGPCTQNKIWGVEVDPAYVWVPDAPEKDWQPDLVIHMDANWIYPDWDYPENFGDVPHVVYGVDNHVRDYNHGQFDHLFLAHGYGYRMGEANVTWLPCGYDPQWFVPGPPLSARANDAAMIGWMYSNRLELLYGLRERAPHLRIVYGLGAIYEHYAAAYHGAIVSLCRSINGDVAQRIFETAAMGCLILTDPLHDAAALGLVDGENCRVYENADHCAAIIHELQNDLSQAERLAKAGQEWALPQTWDARAQVIVDWYAAQQESEVALKRKSRKRADKPTVESDQE